MLREQVRSAKSDRQQSNLLVTLSQIVAFVVGLGAFVYVAGAAVLWVRLYQSDFPADAVVTSLPRELVIGIGLKSVVAPSVILAVIAGLGIVAVTVEGPLRTFSASAPYRTHGTVGLLAGLVGGAIALVFIPNVAWVLGWAAAAGFAYFLALGVGKTLQRERWDLATIGVAAVAIGLLGAVIRVGVEAKHPRLHDAVVCVKDGGDPYRGLFIGEAQSTVYLGVLEDKLAVAVPRDRIGEIWIGPDDHDCSVPEPDPR